MIKQKAKVSVIIPTYNESGNITEMVERVAKLKKIYKLEVIVADGGSTDNTVILAKKAGATKVLTTPKKRGKGIDFWLACKKANGDYIIEIDADLQFDPEQIPEFVQALQNGADTAIGNRKHYNESPLWRTFGNRCLSLLTTVVLLHKIHDVLAGFKAAKHQVMMSLNLEESGFMYESEIVVKTIRMNYKLAQIPVNYRRRMRENSQVSLVKDGLRFVRSIIYYGLLVSPPTRD